jgi:alpha-N-arabinofuranosidase
MYAAHQGGQSLRTVFNAPEVNYDRDAKPASFWGLKGSASVQGKALVLTVVNPHATEAREAQISLRGGSAQSGTVTTLTNSDIRAHNTFEQRTAISPQTKNIAASGNTLNYTFPPASVSKIALTLG